MVPTDTPGAAPALSWRAGMDLDLADLRDRPRLPAGYRLLPWDLGRLQQVADLEHAAYQGSEDARTFPESLATVEACLRSLQQARGSRTFDAERSMLALRGPVLAGHLLAQRTGKTHGFIHDVAVHPEHRGGLGRALLLECLLRFQRDGFRRVSLSVTTANAGAVRLYEGLGFRDSQWWMQPVPRR